MKLQRLTIERLPGIRKTLEIELPSDRVALIIGPNASGKSSLIRALKTLLERKPKSADVLLQAVFDDDGRRVEGRATGSARSWLVEGETSERPDWPEADQLDAYLIRADELIDPDQSEQAIAQAMKQLLSGGIDLDAMLDRAPFKSLAKPNGLKRKLDQAEHAIRALESDYAQINHDVDTLDRLRAEYRASVAAEQRLTRLGRAQEWLAARRDIAGIESRLAELPDGLNRLNGHEAEALDGIQADQDEKHGLLKRQQRELEDAHTALSSLNIEKLEQYQAWRDDLGTLQNELNQSKQRLQDLQQQRAAAEARREQAARRSGGRDPSAIRSLSADRIDAMQRNITAIVESESRLRDLDDAIARRAEQAVDPQQVERTDQAVALLREWLALPPTSWLGWTNWLVLVAAAAGAAGWFYAQQQLNFALISAAAGLMPLSHLVQFGLRGLRSRQIRQAWPMEPLTTWQASDIRQQLRALELEQARHQASRLAQAEAEALQAGRAQAEQQLQAHRQQLNQLATEAALDAQRLIQDGLSLRLQNLHDWQQADTALDQLDKQIRVVKTTFGSLISTTRRCLHKLLPDHPRSFESELLDGLIRQVDDRLNRAQALRSSIGSLEKAQTQTRADLDRLRQRRRELMANAGLTEDQQDDLRQRLDYLDEYRDLSDRLRSLMLSAQQHGQALTGDAELVELVEYQNEAALVDLKTSLQKQADQRETIQQRISDIEHAQADALEGRELELRIAEREALRQQLREQRDLHRMAGAGQFLIERIRDEQQQLHQPELLKRATHWFSRFTQNRYALNFDGQQFSALDQQHGERRGLAALSTATRIQLKLALRLAWIDQLDQHRPPLPIFLDEVLATSDLERYRAVVEAAQELMRQGRQVVYLSAQPTDADAWRQWAGEPEPEIICIGDNRPETVFEFSLPEPDPVPAASLKADDWARQAGVKPIQPWQPAAGIDLFHLLRDELARINDLRHRGIISLGQLELALALEQIELDRPLTPRIAATKAWLQRWRLGRVRPLDRIALAESGLVSEAYIEGVTSVCSHVQGQARDLLDVLRDPQSDFRVAGFGPKKIDALQQWLSDNGYLDEPEPAQDFELIEAMIQAGPLQPAQANELHRWLCAGIVAQQESSE